MKKLFFVLGILSVLSLASNDLSAKPKTTTTTTQSPGSFSAGPFGCWGSGFCTTTTTTTTAIMSTHDNGTVTFNFDYNTFNEQNKDYYNGRDVFENPQDHVLDSKTCQELELPEGTVVLKGTYPITWKDNHMIFIAMINFK